jgi:hypothetical protein
MDVRPVQQVPLTVTGGRMSSQYNNSFTAIRDIRLPLTAISGCAVSIGAQSQLLVDIRPVQQVPLTATSGCMVSTTTPSQQLGISGLLSQLSVYVQLAQRLNNSY